MSIRSKGKGKYLVDYYIKDTITGELYHKSKTVYGLREAKEFEATVPRYGAIQKNSKTLYEMYLESISNSQANPTTVIQYKKRFKKYCNLSDRMFTSIKKSDLIAWNVWLKEQEISNATKNDVINMVKGVYKYANEVYDIPNISNCVKKFKHEKKEKEVLTPEEFNRLIECFDNPIYKAFFHTAYWTGCRRGELKALYKKDLVGDSIYIKRNMPYDEDSLHDCLKNGTTLRIIKLDKETLNILIPLSKRKGKYMFGDETYLANTSLARHLRAALKKANITKEITPHNFRHSHGSVLLDSGLDLASVSLRLGHKDITTTANIYSHVLDKSGQKSVEIIDKIIEKNLR